MVDYNDIESRYKKDCESLEVQPPLDGWARVEASLNSQKKDRKVLWLFLSGVAATLLAFVTLSTLDLFSPKHDNQPLLSINNDSHMNIDRPQEIIQKEPDKIYPDKIIHNNKKDINILSDSNLSQYREQLTLSSVNNHTSKQNRGQYDKVEKREDKEQVKSGKKDEKQSDQIIPYQHSNIFTVSNYFVTDEVEIKSLKKIYAKINWEELFPVKEDVGITKKTSQFGKRIDIGGVYSPVYAYRQASGSTESRSATASNSPDEKGLVNSGGGLRVGVTINKKWSLESGFRFARIGQEVNSQVDVNNILTLRSNDDESTSVLPTVSLDNSLGVIKQISQETNMANNILYNTSSSNQLVGLSASNDYTSGSIEQNLDYIEVPLTFRYYMIKKGMTLSLSAGVSTNWLISNKVYLSNNSDRQYIGETSGISSMTLSSHAGVALSVPIIGRLSLQFEPRVNYFMQEINKDYPVSFKPYSFGVFSGIQYTFGK